MVGRFAGGPKGRPVAANAAGEVVFRGSDGLWLTLAVVAALVAGMTAWLVISTAAEGGGIGWSLLIGGGLALFLALGAWFARGQRREVVVDGGGLAVRTREGAVKVRLAWAEVARIESRPMPGSPTRPAVLFHLADGTSHFIDPLQVHDTASLLAESQRRKKQADDAARAAGLGGARGGERA